jgi:two-component system, cell cycle response regulator DivK
MLLKNKRIFIVEDNLQNRVIYQMMMMQHGAKVEFERWGKDAVARIKMYAPLDLIILDLMLSHGITGYDIFDQIRPMPEIAGVPIIAVSAAEPAVAIPQVRARGFDGFIAKPLDDVLFPQQIARIIDKQPVWHIG